MRRFLACLALIVLTSPAAACLNDAELPIHEREFRSQYNRQIPPPAPAAEPAYPDGSSLLLGGGSLLLIGAVGVAGLGARTRK
jgi:hypothetical protein